MGTVAEIGSAIARLSLSEAKEVRDWLEHQQEIILEFPASIERGNADLAAGRVILH